MDEDIKKLSDIKENTDVVVKSFSGGINSERRLLDLGIIPGETIKVLKNDHKGPLLICVKNTTIALGRGISMKVIVEEVK